MRTYKEFRPTSFDNHYYLEGRENWFVLPVYRNRDSNCLERANWDAAVSELGKENEDSYEIHRFGHWGPGWFEIILINPHNDELVKIAEGIENILFNYPVLDDELFSQYEYEEANAVWKECYNEKQRIDYIRKNPSTFDFRDFLDMVHCVRGDYFCGYASELLG